MKIIIHKKNKIFIFNFFAFSITFVLVIFSKIFKLKLYNFYYLSIFIPIISLFLTQKIFDIKNIFFNIKQKSFKNIYINRFLLTFLFAIFFCIFIFCLNLLIGKIFGKIHFSNNYFDLEQKYLAYFNEKNLQVFKKFTNDLGVNFFWASNTLSGIILGLTYSSFIFFLELSVWFSFIWDELRLMSFWQKNIYIGIVRGIIQSSLAFLGIFGNFSENKNLIFAILIFFFNIFYFPILGLIFKNFKSIIYPAIFSGLIFSLSEMATFFIVGCDKIFIDVNGIVGIFGLIIINIILYLDYNTRVLLIKNKIIHKINK